MVSRPLNRRPQDETVHAEAITRLEREFIKDILPKGYKVFKGVQKSQIVWIVNPGGKKFETVQEVGEYLRNNQNSKVIDDSTESFTDEEQAFLEKVLPQGWKAIKARYNNHFISFIISPSGKRFETLQDAHDFIEEEKEKKVSRRETLLGKLFESEKTPLALSENAKIRRKLMAHKSSFRNLLQKTLEKNHVLNASHEQTSINYQKYLSKRKRHLKKSKGL